MTSVELREKDLATLRGALKRFPFVREVLAFGSRATGGARRASDLDLAISAPDATAEEWADLLEAIEQAPIIYELDIVRLDQTANARLLERIERDGIIVYPEEDAVQDGQFQKRGNDGGSTLTVR